jgi:hypothetical protein
MAAGSAFLRKQKMSDTGSFALRGAAIAAAMLITSTFPLQIASASSEQQLKDTQPPEPREPVALYITLCLWSQQHPTPTCHEVPLTPGAGGPGFASLDTCHSGQEDALKKWQAEAGPVFGFKAMEGDGYRIDRVRCSPIENSPLISDTDD